MGFVMQQQTPDQGQFFRFRRRPVKAKLCHPVNRREDFKQDAAKQSSKGLRIRQEIMFRMLGARWIHLNRTSNPNKLILVYLEHRDRIAEALAKRICTELQGIHLNAQQTDALVSSCHVPYTVVITKRTMFDGVLKLKHFTPRVDEEVHVSDLKDRILHQMGSVTLRSGSSQSGSSSSSSTSCNDNKKDDKGDAQST